MTRKPNPPERVPPREPDPPEGAPLRQSDLPQEAPPRMSEPYHDERDALLAGDYVGLENSGFASPANAEQDLPPPYALDEGRCAVCPGRVAVWRVKGRDGLWLSALAATVLVHDGAIDPVDLELLRPSNGDDGSEDIGYTDPFSSLAVNVYGTVREVLEGAAAGPLEAHRQLEMARQKKQYPEYESPAGPSSYRTGDILNSSSTAPRGDRDGVLFDCTSDDTSSTYSGVTPSHGTSEFPDGQRSKPKWSVPIPENPYAAVAASTGVGIANIIGAGLKVPATYTHGLAQGFNNMPRLYGDDTVRKEDKIDGVGSGLLAAGKGLGFGLYDGLTGFVTQPVRGAQQEGAVGFLKGFGKGLGGLVCKPAAGACGVPGYAFMGVYKSLVKSNPDASSVDDLRAKTYVAQGEGELGALKEADKRSIIANWRALQVSQHSGTSRQ